jgi:predicted dienelactone hydrolase
MRCRHLSLAAVFVAASACGGGDDNDPPAVAEVTTTQSAPRATDAPAPDPAATEPPDEPVSTEPPEPTEPTGPTIDEVRFDEPGDFPVGVTTLQLDTGPSVEVWYPAVDGTTGSVTYDVRDFTPPAIRELLTGDVPATFTFAGARDVGVADGVFPVVLFSHGASGMRLQSSFLTSHLASHGMIVVAPDHPSRDLMNALGGRTDDEQTDPVDDLLGSLDLILAENDDEASRFAGRVEPGRVAALGHSAGGGTILGAALDDRVGSYVSMAAGGPAEGSEFPDVPSLFVAGATDEIVTPADRTRPAFEAAPAPTAYVEIAETGHNGFNDFCTFGGGTGIIGIAEASGLGPVLDDQPRLRRLGEDGCVPPAAPVDRAFPIVLHATTSFLRWSLGTDPEPVGFDAATFEAFGLGTLVERR